MLKTKMCALFLFSALCSFGAGHEVNAGLGVVCLCLVGGMISMYFGIKILEDIIGNKQVPDKVLHHLCRNTGYLVHTKMTAYGKTILELTDLATQKGCTANLEGEYPPPGFHEVQMDGNDFLVPWCMKVVSIFALMEDEEVDHTHTCIT